MLLLAMMLTATTAGAQNLTTFKVVTEKPTVTGGQNSNWGWDGSENYDKLVDGNTSTKYGLSDADPWVEFHYEQPITPAGYALWTANDTKGGRNPKSWIIKAKLNAKDDWTTLAEVDNSDKSKLPMADETETRFALNKSATYRFFRFEAERPTDSDGFQLAELQFLYNPDPAKLQFAAVTGVNSRYIYTGSPISIAPVVKSYGGTPLTLGTHFTATLNGSAVNAFPLSVTAKGDYTLEITAKNGSDYTGTKIIVFTVTDYLAINLPQNVEHGTFTASPTSALEGDKVTITATWDEGYYLEFNSLKDANDNNQKVHENWYKDYRTFTFTMPATAVTFDATISAQHYRVETPHYGEQFSINATPFETTVGTTVTLTVNKTDGVQMSNLMAMYKFNSGGGEQKMAPRRYSEQYDSEDEDWWVTLPLTKVSDTEYTFVMPASDVRVSCDVSYKGAYAINLASGLDPEATRFRIGDIEATSANAGDKVWMDFGTDRVENLTVTGVTSGKAVEVNTNERSFIMPAEAVTVSATPLFYIHCNRDEYYTVTASVNGANVLDGNGDGYIAPGNTVTLAVKSTDSDNILSYLNVGKEGERIPLTYVGKTSEEGYPHVYTYTFTMPSNTVQVYAGFGGSMTITFYANGGEGEMKPIVIGQGGRINLPECGFTAPEGYTFAGWTCSDWWEGIYPAGKEVQLGWSDQTITAQWMTGLTLLNDDSEASEGEKNADIIADIINSPSTDGKYFKVTLQGRTLYKDGKWNTLCLPFDLGVMDGNKKHWLDGTPLEGAKVMTLNEDMENGYDAESGALHLWFSQAWKIKAGVPYLVRWEKADGYDNNPSAYDIVNPVFSGVTFSDEEAQTIEIESNGLEVVQMVGCYSPVPMTKDDKSCLFLNANNQLCWPNVDNYRLGAFRAYFSVPYIKEYPEAQARAFNLHFPDGSEEKSGLAEITEISLTPSPSPKGEGSDEWHTLDGRKLSSKPTRKGLYIHGNRKVVIK